MNQFFKVLSTQLVIMSSIFLINGVSHAGTRDGGGGVGVRCQVGQKEILELLDLHEARLKGLIPLGEPKDDDSALELLSDLFSRHFWNVDTIPIDEMKKALNYSIITPIFYGHSWWNVETQKMESVQYVEDLPLSTDIGSFHIQPNCELVQIAYYDDQLTTLKIVKSLWDKLSTLNKIALETHELAYLLTRRSGVENQTEPQLITSESSRELVGQLFSTSGAVQKFPRSVNWSCRDDISDKVESYFYISSLSNGNGVLTFSLLHGAESVFQMIGTVTGIDFEKLIDPAISYDKSITVPVLFTGDSKAPRVNLNITKSGNNYPKIQFFKEGFVPMGPAKDFRCHTYN